MRRTYALVCVGRKTNERSKVVIKLPCRNQKPSRPPVGEPHVRSVNRQSLQLLDFPTVVLDGDLYTKLHAYVRAAEEREITLYATSEAD